MDFQPTEQQRQMVEAFRKLGDTWFTRENIVQWEHDQGVTDDVARAFVEEYSRHSELMPEQSVGGSLVAQTLVAEEIARSSGALLPFANDILNLRIMEEFAGSGQFADLLEAFLSTGRLAFALAISEPQAGTDTRNMKTSVHAVDGRLILNGHKTFVANGEYAPNIVVAAIDTDAEAEKYPPLSFWLIPRDLHGIRAYPISKIGQKMLPFSDVLFDNVEIDPSCRLENTIHSGFRQLFHLFEIGRLSVCASSLGMAQAATEDAVRYAQQRMAFGEPIMKFQNIAQMIVDMEVKLNTMRYLVYSAAWAVDRRLADRRLKVALMKRYVPGAATEVASDALQIFGGLGYTERLRVSQIWQDCRGNQIAEGTDQIMVSVAAPLIVEKYGNAAL